MSIAGSNTVLNQFVPPFVVKSLFDGQVLTYDSAKRAFVNRNLTDLTMANQPITLTGDAQGTGTEVISVTLANTGVQPGTYRAVTVNSKGLITQGDNPTTLSGYGITDAQPLNVDLTAITGLPDLPGIARKLSTGQWALDTTPYIAENQPIDITGDVTGSGSTTINLTLANSGVWPGTYNQGTTSVQPFTVDAKGRITSVGSPVELTPDFSSLLNRPSTLAGYGINDAQPLDEDLTAISNLVGASGVLKKLASNTWVLDETGYLTGNENIVISGDATGSGTTSITLTLANSGISPGSYGGTSTTVQPFTVDTKGRVTGVGSPVTITPDFSNVLNRPSTLSGYGITDAQPLDSDLTAIASLVGPVGLLRKTASDTWALDTTNYLTGNETITFSGDVAGSGTNSVTLTLANTGVTPGSYRSVTVDAKGRVTSGSNPTSLSEYGITDAQPLDGDLTAIAGLTGTSGILRKTAADSWSLDTGTYLTGNQNITVTGDVTGSGTTALNLSLPLVMTAGTYNNSSTSVTPLTVDAKGRITGAGSPVTITPAFSSVTGKPTTLAGYGITDAQPLDGDLTAIAGLTGTSGFLRKTAADTWTLDTSGGLGGLPPGGATGAYLAKRTSADYDTEWITGPTATTSVLVTTVKNVGTTTLPKGTPVYSTGTGVSNGFLLDVAAADASNPSKMPAVGVLNANLAPGAEGQMLILGEIHGVDTSSYPSGSEVYVAPGGGWRVGPPPTGVVQFLGIVTRQNSNGGGYVTGTGRPDNFIWTNAGFVAWNGSTWTLMAPQSAVDAKENTGVAAGLVASHVAAPDPHPQYTTAAEAAASAPVQSVAGRTGSVVLTSADVGLGMVDNTSDVNKPISSATQTALNAKQATLVSGTNIKTINGETLLGSGDITITGGGGGTTTFNIDGGDSNTIFTNNDIVIDGGNS